ncbi:hypothetical protein C8Q76DRAFT_694755 [Earliella scabrosa]|nr:hypothetical protein C8Q76DRAFT_694755 [Earliella scabrosa]
MHALSLVFVAVLAGQVAGNTHAVRSSVSGLLARQADTGLSINLNDFPSTCRSDCSDAVIALNTCTEARCLCSEDMHGAIAACFECMPSPNSNDTSVLASAQARLEEYESQCKDAGVEVTPINLASPYSGDSNGAATIALSSGAIVGAVGIAMVVFAS